MIYRDLIQKYKQKLERELNTEKSEEQGIIYSRAYQLFKREQVSKFHSFYERACTFSEKTLKVDISAKDSAKVSPFLKLSHLAISPRSVYSFAYLTTDRKSVV